MSSREPDIDWVVVTGAGASREFGVNGDKFPLMGDWSSALLHKLAQHINYADLTGLRRGMPEEKFETQLGKFLKQVEAFSQIEPLLEPSLQLGDFGPGMHITSMAQWHKSTVHHLGEITELIRESLYDQFAERPIDRRAAAAAYSSLFNTLGIGAATRWVYATTNYDTIAERVISDIGLLPDWGQAHALDNEGEHPLQIPGLLNSIGRYVPVLHLHGRVGWYRRDGHAYAASITKHQRGFGIPVVMLPDPNKAYDQDDIITAMWQQFEEALARAKHVFVLGHSLNDTYLLRALAQNVEHTNRIAVTVLANELSPGEPDTSAAPVVDKVSNTLHGATAIPIRFGTDDEVAARAIQKWLG
jgi:hypothetical protein